MSEEASTLHGVVDLPIRKHGLGANYNWFLVSLDQVMPIYSNFESINIVLMVYSTRRQINEIVYKVSLTHRGYGISNNLSTY